MSIPKHAASPRVTFREVLAQPEFRAVFAAGGLSQFGDYLARAAVTALVYSASGSVALSAASFAIGYVPTLLFGPMLAALAERYPQRRLMIGCDIGRAAIIAIVALPGLPVPFMLLLLFCAAMMTPSFDASRSSLLPRLLDGDRYVVALSARATVDTTAMVAGYSVGGLIAPTLPHVVLLFDAVTFLVSAAFIWRGVSDRPVLGADRPRRGLLHETAEGFRVVASSPVLRPLAVLVFSAGLFATVPEALAASWAAEITHGGANRGVVQGIIMMAGPVGGVAGSVLIGRFASPARRRRLLRPLGMLTPLILVPMLIEQPVAIIAVLTAICNFAGGGLAAAANGLFVSALPANARARAFGVMQFGLQAVQGGSIVAVGVLGDHMTLGHAIGWWAVGGVALVALTMVNWPTAPIIDDELVRIAEANAALTAAVEPEGTSTARHRAGSTPAPRGGTNAEGTATSAGRVPTADDSRRDGVDPAMIAASAATLAGSTDTTELTSAASAEPIAVPATPREPRATPDGPPAAQSGTPAPRGVESGTAALRGSESGTPATREVESGTAALRGSEGGTPAPRGVESGTAALRGSESGTASLRGVEGGTPATRGGEPHEAHAEAAVDAVGPAQAAANGRHAARPAPRPAPGVTDPELLGSAARHTTPTGPEAADPGR